MPTSEERSDYINRVAFRDETWRLRSACRNSSPQIVTMFTCTEDETFEMFDKQIDGYHIQCYLVESYCRTCPVQWECARHAIEVEEVEAGDRSTGAWAMTRRDRRWLFKQSNALGIIDQAHWDGVPVSVAVADARRV